MAATLADLEDWLSKITENPRLTYEAVIATRTVPQGGAGGGGGQFGTNPNFAADLDAARKGGAGGAPQGGGGYGGGSLAGMSAEENWLIKIAEHTRLTHESLTGRARSLASGGGAASGRDWPPRLDDLIERLGKRIEGAIGRGVNWGNSQVQSLRQRGMSGTLESARLDYGMEQLSRQMAAIFLPFTQATGYLVANLERRLRGLDGDGQDRMMGVLAGAGLGMRFGGVPGAIFGGATGLGMAGGGNTTGAMVGMASGAYLGARVAGPVGAVAGGAMGLATGSSRSYADERPRAYYDRMRADGGTMFGAALSTLGESLTRFVSNPLPGAPPAPGARAPTPRREVTPYSAEMTDAGTQHFIMQASMIRATAGPSFEDGGPFQPFMDMLIKIYDVLMKILDPRYVPPRPPSMEEAR